MNSHLEVLIGRSSHLVRAPLHHCESQAFLKLTDYIEDIISICITIYTMLS